MPVPRLFPPCPDCGHKVYLHTNAGCGMAGAPDSMSPCCECTRTRTYLKTAYAWSLGKSVKVVRAPMPSRKTVWMPDPPGVSPDRVKEIQAELAGYIWI